MAYFKGMIALRWKDKKDVFFLTTIHSPPVVPAEVEDDNSGTESEAVRNESDMVCRRVRLRGRWVNKKIYRPDL